MSRPLPPTIDEHTQSKEAEEGTILALKCLTFTFFVMIERPVSLFSDRCWEWRII